MGCVRFKVQRAGGRNRDLASVRVDFKVVVGVGQAKREAGQDFAGVPFDDVGSALIVRHVLPLTVWTDRKVVFPSRPIRFGGSPVGVEAVLSRRAGRELFTLAGSIEEVPITLTRRVSTAQQHIAANLLCKVLHQRILIRRADRSKLTGHTVDGGGGRRVNRVQGRRDGVDQPIKLVRRRIVRQRRIVTQNLRHRQWHFDDADVRHQHALARVVGDFGKADRGRVVGGEERQRTGFPDDAVGKVVIAGSRIVREILRLAIRRHAQCLRTAGVP
ncbi:hypothetical protein Pla100_60550 [Neorhodopirellula pilleata]|uniref:Uncharacterized protein n=1 Tax=Neorhodopirellula pilleata TaxID=2714738 RepID=A0A5C5ZH31_9BACT|nr:hypothetical protein Pla100_60550 [Neorhodopirellula pilleata]